MNYCSECGQPLEERYVEHEGNIPYCKACDALRFPFFSTAVSMIVVNPQKDKILLIQQYHRPNNILVAGYVDKGEALEETIRRECEEEIGRKILAHEYLRSEYFEKSNTIICNFAVIIDSESLEDVSDWEVDKATWFRFDEAKKAIKPDSLAERFLSNFFKQLEVGHVQIMR